MWMITHSTIAKNLNPQQVWKIWSNISRRPEWDIDTEWAELNGEFKKGARFYFKPKGGPKLAMTITECIPNECFTDCFKLPGARLYGIHRMETTAEGLKITTSIKTEGLFGWLLKKMIGEKIAAEVPEQTALLIKVAEHEQ